MKKIVINLAVTWFLLAVGVGCAAPEDLRVATKPPPAREQTNTPTPIQPPATSEPPTPTTIVAGEFQVHPPVIGNPEPEGEAWKLPSDPLVLVSSEDDELREEDPLYPFSIEYLASRTYGDATYGASTLTFLERLESPYGFSRALITYLSDGLTIYGFMNIPSGKGPFPVVIFIHGYVEAAKYKTLDYSVRYADDLARRGFIVIHPNLRGYPPSDSGPDYFEIGKAIDVLNLVGIVQRQAGKTGLLLQADPDRIAVWGHSTGGGIAIRVAAINLPSLTGPGPAVKAAILYAPMSGDETLNAYRTFYTFSGQTRWKYEITIPPEQLGPISPVYHYDRIEAAVQIHHGRQDHLIPVEWSHETCSQMKEAGVTVECYDYRTQTHNFCCDSYQWMLDRIVSFLGIYMR